jgi:hypothetical protein
MPSRINVQEIRAKTLNHDPTILLEACAKRKQSRFLAKSTALLSEFQANCRRSSIWWSGGQSDNNR